MGLKRAAQIWTFSLFFLLAFSLPLGWALEPSPLRVGLAKVDLTPAFPCPLAGYGKRWGAKARGVHDPLYARALILEGGGEKIALVGVDLVVVTRCLRAEVLRRLRPLGFSAFLLCATHNHSGVGGYWDHFLAEWIAMGKYDRRVYAFLVERISRAVLEAEKKKFAARVGVGARAVLGFNRNRRNPAGPVDPELGVLRIDDKEGKPVAVLVNFSAHATVLGPKNLLLSGDYPGALAANLEKELALALFTAGASGDLSPRAPTGRDSYERAYALGSALAKRVRELMAGIPTQGQVVLQGEEQEVLLPRATTRSLLPFPFFFLANPFFRLWTPSTTLLQVLRINGLSLSAWPCDLGVEIGLELKEQAPKEWGHRHLWVVSQANDYIGYVLPEKEYEKGGYEARMSFFGPRLGEVLKEQMVELLERVS